MNNEELKLLSVSRAATLLGIGTRALRSLIADGRIGVLCVGKRQKISHKDINKFLESSTKEITKLPHHKDSSQKLNNNSDLNTILENLIKEKKNGIYLQA